MTLEFVLQVEQSELDENPPRYGFGMGFRRSAGGWIW
jgi:hypothetical protein